MNKETITSTKPDKITSIKEIDIETGETKNLIASQSSLLNAIIFDQIKESIGNDASILRSFLSDAIDICKIKQGNKIDKHLNLVDWEQFIKTNKITLGHHENEIKTFYAVRDNKTIQIDVPISRICQQSNLDFFKRWSRVGFTHYSEDSFIEGSSNISALANIENASAISALANTNSDLIQSVLQSLLIALLNKK